MPAYVVHKLLRNWTQIVLYAKSLLAQSTNAAVKSLVFSFIITTAFEDICHSADLKVTSIVSPSPAHITHHQIDTDITPKNA